MLNKKSSNDHNPICKLKVVPDVAGTANNLTEEKISDKCFELMFAFDEVG